MKNKKVLKNSLSFTLYFINTLLVLIDIMLLVELNACLLFYSVSINIIILNTYIIHNFSSRAFNDKYMYLLREN